MPENTSLHITSSAFEESGTIPRRYTCEGANINPPLELNNIPAGTETIAIIMDDPDAPHGTFTHWLIWNLPPDISVPEGRKHNMNGTNDADSAGYYGPCPPNGSHRYYFRVYALDTALQIDNGANRQTLEDAISGHVLANGSLMGRYEKMNSNSASIL